MQIVSKFDAFILFCQSRGFTTTTRTYMHPPLLKYATQLLKSNSNCQRVHEGRPPGPCINFKREDVTKRYWHLSVSQRRDQPLFYTFVKNAYGYAFKGIAHSKMIMITVFVECVRLDLENHSKCPTIQKQHQAKEN